MAAKIKNIGQSIMIIKLSLWFYGFNLNRGMICLAVVCRGEYN